MDMVDRVKGMPNFAAARAARISPSACCMPVRPVGAMAAGIATGSPIMAVRVDRFDISTAIRCRSDIFSKSSQLARNVFSVQDPDSM